MSEHDMTTDCLTLTGGESQYVRALYDPGLFDIVRR